ncbi:uncharacterized protein CC84DRAFT_1146465 [Paraphaeosphaeria sporulosa]|uniref:DUF3074 domain-containing protein n=1 Tax=Paraphaeosphaeria sporulosa TaxID=1460663 RepID=A0A177CHP1_9PLEO|nr:uncharacterized protein CC84DRAFT_1146465 [Paraphaeosphaeria sporulosa]OAG06388.1 hypothetical protein CC84DRAFT_1146465 [Paraphaeosphaeria sporulosa]
MAELHKALECLRPKDFADIPVNDLKTFLPEIFAKAELIANSVPPPPNGTPYESSQRSRSDANCARSAAELTISKARRPIRPEHEALHKAWGKPVKLGAKETATGISVFKMAGHDRHGAWFARTSVHEGLGFAKWKKAMMREFPASLEVQGGPGEGNVRGIGGDQRLEDINVDGIGKLEVYQLSAQFPGPTAPREFLTLLLTSPNCLSNASKVGDVMPRHYMVVSIPVSHESAPPRDGMVRGQYESVEMIREIPLAHSRHTNPVEWIMITRSDPGGGIPRFMVERGTPGSIVNDAGKFLDWACSNDDFPSREEDEQHSTVAEPLEEHTRQSFDRQPRLSIVENNGILAGVGTSIADRPVSIRHPSQRNLDAIAQAINSLHRTDSQSSTATSLSSIDSFASAEQYNTAPEGPPVSSPLSTTSNTSIPLASGDSSKSPTQLQDRHNRELQKIEEKRAKLKERLDAARSKQDQSTLSLTTKSEKELEKTAEKHAREKKKQEEKFAKEVRKLEARRERETKKLLARQQKEADKTALQKAQRERDEYKSRAELAEQELRIVKEQIGELQRENTALVAGMGKSEKGMEVLRRVREELEGKKGRERAGSRGSNRSGGSGSGRKSGHQREGSGLAKGEGPE